MQTLIRGIGADMTGKTIRTEEFLPSFYEQIMSGPGQSCSADVQLDVQAQLLQGQYSVINQDFGRYSMEHQVMRSKLKSLAHPTSYSNHFIFGNNHSCLHRGLARQFATVTGTNTNMDCYAILKVKMNATDADIKKSFYDLAKKYHPDQQADACEEIKLINKDKFQRVQAAYEILSDPEQREKYDLKYPSILRNMQVYKGTQKNGKAREWPENHYQGESSWTYDSKGNKRKNYGNDPNTDWAGSGEAYGDPNQTRTQQQRRGGSPGARNRSNSYSGYSNQQNATYSTASYGQHQYQSQNDQLFKFGMGTLGVISIITFFVADTLARGHSNQNQLTASTYHGHNQKGMVSSVANDFRVDAMRQVSYGMSSNYSPQISKSNFQSDDVRSLLGNTDKQKGGTKSKTEFELQFKKKKDKKEQDSILKQQEILKEQREIEQHIKDNKVEKIQEIHYVKHCEQCKQKEDLQNKIRELEVKLMKFELQKNASKDVPLSLQQRSQSAPANKVVSSIQKPEKKVVRLRSIGNQTFIDSRNFGSTDLGLNNPFYKADNTDEEQYDRRQALQLSTLAPVDLDQIKPSGGTLSGKKGKKTKMSASATADCFKPETVGLHVNKGGDGFEAWKGNRRVIKKRKIGVIKVEQKVVPREGQFVQPFNFQTGWSK